MAFFRPPINTLSVSKIAPRLVRIAIARLIDCLAGQRAQSDFPTICLGEVETKRGLSAQPTCRWVVYSGVWATRGRAAGAALHNSGEYMPACGLKVDNYL